mgnify:CR=1 FL=1
MVSKKSKNVVHYVSLISMIGVAICTASLILVLSVFNGFEKLILSLYNSFDPPIKVSVLDSKVSDFLEAKTYLNDNNIKYSEVLEEKVLLRYQDNEYIATLKGVDNNFKSINSIDSLLIVGDYLDSYTSTNTAIVGQGIAYHLSMNIGNIFDQLQLYIPDRELKNLLRPETSFIQQSVLPVGVFAIQSDFDSEYVLTNIEFMREVLNRDSLSSSLEILCADSKIFKIQSDLKTILGNSFSVKNRYQQHAFLYKILNSEKLAVFIILSFIIVIATFNIISALTMQMIDKKKDIILLSNLGASPKLIKLVFFLKGVLTSTIGLIIGLLIGLFIAWLQIKFGIIKMGNGSFVVDDYPVDIHFSDIILVLSTVFAIGCIASLIPARYLVKRYF